MKGKHECNEGSNDEMLADGYLLEEHRKIVLWASDESDEVDKRVVNGENKYLKNEVGIEIVSSDKVMYHWSTQYIEIIFKPTLV